MRMIRLTGSGDETAYVNPDNIVAIIRNRNHTTVYLDCELREFLSVKESPENIIQKISVLE